MTKSLKCDAAVVGATMLAIIAAVPAHAAPVFPDAGYQLVYDLPIPASANYNDAAVPYTVNNAATIADGSFDRVGYLLTLQTGNITQYLAVSMDAFATSAALIGVPTVASTEFYNDVAVADMDVESDIAGVATGTGISTGYVQFWPGCYSNQHGDYATGEDIVQTGSSCYGSMQIGNGIGDTVFAYNAWDDDNGDLGIGNDPAGANPDWTFAFNAGSYTSAELSIWVSAAPEPASFSLLLAGIGIVSVVRRRNRVATR